jgi:DDE superfamily endonuclease
VRRTWAPRGQTPILRHRYRRREQVSMAGLLADRPDGSKTRLLFAFERGAYDTDRLIRVLDRLEGFLGSAPVTLIWDNLGAHRSKAMRAYVATHDWVELEFLPPYAPELKGGRGPVGQPEGHGVGQPVRRVHRAGHRHRPARPHPHPP